MDSTWQKTSKKKSKFALYDLKLPPLYFMLELRYNQGQIRDDLLSKMLENAMKILKVKIFC